VERLLFQLERWLLPFLAFLLAFITVGVFIQVCMRYLFALSFLWGEELSLFAFIWCVFLGAAINVHRRNHFALDVLATTLRGRAAALQLALVDLVTLFVAAVMVVEGWRFAELSIKRLSPALGISLLVPTSIIPAAAAYIVLVALLQLAGDARRLVQGDAAR
jgi:TRAP-type C4-dicarboxylate transport system permease small subunit